MQILIPGNHPSLHSLLILIGLISSLVLISIALYQKNKKFNYLLIATSILGISFITYNLINYQHLLSSLKNKYAGLYKNEQLNVYIHLKESDEWTSNYPALGLTRGTWKHTINEDFESLELYDLNKTISILNSYDFNEHQIAFTIKKKSFRKGPEENLIFHKTHK